MKRCCNCHKNRADSQFVNDGDLCSRCVDDFRIAADRAKPRILNPYSTNDSPRMIDIIFCEGCGEKMTIREMVKHIKVCKVMARVR